MMKQQGGAVNSVAGATLCGFSMADWVEQLLRQQNECALSWVKRDGSPAVTIVSYVWSGQSLWMTALAGSGRVAALQREPRAALVVTGKGVPSGASRCVSMQGRVAIREEAAVRDWFFPAFARAVLPDSPKGAAMMAGMMRGPENLVLQFVPDRCIPWDSHDSMVMANNL